MTDEPTPDKPPRDLEIRRITEGELPLVEQFVNECYGAGAPFKQRARLQWQFVDTPYRRVGAPPTIFAALSRGRVVGTIGVQDGRALVHGTPAAMGWVVDVMIHPEFRGRGIGHMIHDRALADRSTLITLTMAEATRRIAMKAGAITLGPTREFIRPIRVSATTVKSFLSGKADNAPGRHRLISAFNATRVGPILLAGVVRVIGAIRKPRRSPVTDLRVEEVEEFPVDVDALWEGVAEHHPTMFERSARFLNWRFVEAPELNYRLFLLWEGDSLRGYLVTRDPNAVELPVGTVVDFLAAPGDSDALDALLTHAHTELASRCEYLEAAASSVEYRSALKRAGFVATRTMRPTIVCTDSDLRAGLWDTVDRWHFTKADHDWDQVHPA
ncbi:MAG: GNAT family N-acetyltransferase [Microthrixaceae bacterium]